MRWGHKYAPVKACNEWVMPLVRLRPSRLPRPLPGVRDCYNETGLASTFIRPAKFRLRHHRVTQRAPTLYSYRRQIYGWNMAKRYTVSDGKLVLTLEQAPEGGYVVTAPLEPELITEAETISEAFENAADALKALRQSRVKLLRSLTPASASRRGA